MQKMKAYVRTSSQDQNVELMEIPIPEIGENEVLVKVQAFGVGIHDRYFIPGSIFSPGNITFPYVIGIEGAGVIVRNGARATRFQPRDRVIFMSFLQEKGGCWAEYVAVPEDALIPLPEKMDFTEGAAMPVAGRSSLDSMRSLDLETGDTLFVAGASGAIGTMVIQLATARGIRVVGSASKKNHDHMLSLGAEYAVDYSDPNWKQTVKEWFPEGVTAALAIQPGTAEGSMDVVKDGGKVVTVSGDQVEPERNISVYQFEHQEDTKAEFVQLVTDITEGRIQLVIEHVYPFSQALDALRKTETRHARGKLAVTLEDA